jgi:hypothetical protein
MSGLHREEIEFWIQDLYALSRWERVRVRAN